jgi:hypothetical protein
MLTLKTEDAAATGQAVQQRCGGVAGPVGGVQGCGCDVDDFTSVEGQLALWCKGAVQVDRHAGIAGATLGRGLGGDLQAL